ncbi:uncharacterized protein LTR77_002512 [Saxophila tyrrhenica]|uniref:Uncharacterized protein n=1 Tax=Saxophila tyrrhenica TaxID=1690608 RepID=A0AAV9PNJ2_9PEZI|nr:hypothetical protein LTR77_002512 [Saxophila tyrrhenica]
MDEKRADESPSSDTSDTSGDVERSGDINERALIRKLDFRLLPAVTVLYLLSFLDRSNVANAKVEGLAEATNMTDDGYLTGLTLFFLGYVLFEIPCNIILKRTTPRFWLPTLTVIWGVVATLLGIVQHQAGFYAARFFLGSVESGLFPGVVFYLSLWCVQCSLKVHNLLADCGFVPETCRALVHVEGNSDRAIPSGTSAKSANSESPCSSPPQLSLVLSVVSSHTE